MRVDRIDLYSNGFEIARFDVNILDVRNPYIIKAITGLDADQIIPRFYGQGLQSGTKFYDMALEAREIAMRIGLNPNYNLNVNPSDLRSDLYRAVASSRNGMVQLKFVDDGSVVGMINGFVSKFEAPIFSKEPEVQLTLRCEDPIFKSEHLASVIIGSLVYSPYTTVVDPVSTCPHGFKMKVTYTTNTFGFAMSEPEDFPDWQFEINYAFLTGDQLYISSEAGDKYIYRVRSSAILYLMDLIEIGSIWPIIFPGENRFFIGGAPSAVTVNEWYWYETHWGV